MIAPERCARADRCPWEGDIAPSWGLSRSSRASRCGALAESTSWDAEQGRRPYVDSLEPRSCSRAELHRGLPQARHGASSYSRSGGSWKPAATDGGEGDTEEQIGELWARCWTASDLGKHPEVEDLVAKNLEFHRRSRPAPGKRLRCSLLETLSAPRPGPGVRADPRPAPRATRSMSTRAILDAARLA